MKTRSLVTAACLLAGCLAMTVQAQDSRSDELQPDDRDRVDAAIPRQAPATPQAARRILVTNLSRRDGAPFEGPSFAVAPVSNYAIARMGEVTGAYEAVFDNDIERFRPASLATFDAIVFNNSTGVLFEDPELRQSLVDFVRSGKGLVGIHDAIATFVQWPVYDQWPEFGRMLGGTENGGHPWNNVELTIRVEDPGNPINAAFEGGEFTVVDQAFQLQEPEFRDRLHVLFSIDAEKTGTEGRRMLPARAEDLDFPMSWIHPYGDGRVYYLAFGHSAPTFWSPTLLRHLLAGIQYAVGDLQVNDTPDGVRPWAR